MLKTTFLRSSKLPITTLLARFRSNVFIPPTMLDFISVDAPAGSSAPIDNALTMSLVIGLSTLTTISSCNALFATDSAYSLNSLSASLSTVMWFPSILTASCSSNTPSRVYAFRMTFLWLVSSGVNLILPATFVPNLPIISVLTPSSIGSATGVANVFP